jgi:EmrB/QacA subfamily drug resistance transporter
MNETRNQTQPKGRKGLVLFALCLGMFMMQLDATVVNVALPEIGRDLHASVSDLQWIVDAYIIPLAALLLIAGRVGDRYGHKLVFLVGLSVFALGSGLCALAPSSEWLIGFRALQGFGAALELPGTLALLTYTFTTDKERAQAIGIWAGVAGVSLAVGPVLGGVMVDQLGWESVFVINLPIAALAFAIAARTVRIDQDRSRGPLDLAGQAFGTLTLALAAYAAIEGRNQGWGSPLIIALFAASAVCLVLFVAVERRSSNPVLPLRILRNRTFSASNAAGLVMGFALFGLLFLFSLYFEVIQGVSPTDTGLRFLPLSIAFIVVGPLTGRLVSRTGYRLPMSVGLGLVGVGTLLLANLDVDTPYSEMWWRFGLIGVGYGLASTPMAAVVMASVSSARFGMASSMNNTARQVGGVFGVAIVGALLGNPPRGGNPAERAAYAQGFTDDLHTAVWTCAIAALVGALAAAVFVRTPEQRGEARSDDGAASNGGAPAFATATNGSAAQSEREIETTEVGR